MIWGGIRTIFLERLRKTTQTSARILDDLKRELNGFSIRVHLFGCEGWHGKEMVPAPAV